jgi:hypothetical protein
MSLFSDAFSGFLHVHFNSLQSSLTVYILPSLSACCVTSRQHSNPPPPTPCVVCTHCASIMVMYSKDLNNVSEGKQPIYQSENLKVYDLLKKVQRLKQEWQKRPAGTKQTDGKNLVWFGEIKRKLAKLSKTTFSYRSSS